MSRSALAQQPSPLYAVIDLGSNSFHMLIARLVADSVQIVDKVKRKVRLASGLDANNQLDQAAFLRGLECLNFFAERLQDIPKENIRIVATATLRIANNADAFLAQAEQVLQHPIQLLSGTQEAEQIYLGVAHTNCSSQHRLVLDIGGASTEVVAGEGFNAKVVNSLNMGCVTFNRRFFADNRLTDSQFQAAVDYAKSLLQPLIPQYKKVGWQVVLGGSGTMQALAEILAYRQQPAIIYPELLHEMRQLLCQQKSIDTIKIAGLGSERVPVFASGLAILSALFESLAITELQLSSGAIREGLLYEMLPKMRQVEIRQRTIRSLGERFHIDVKHAERVLRMAQRLQNQIAADWQLTDQNLFSLLNASCLLHEIGLLLEYKYHQQHSAYILQHAELPGFDQNERQFLVWLVQNYKADINQDESQNLRLCSTEQAAKHLVLLRLAVILCRRRKDDVLPEFSTRCQQNTLTLSLPDSWMSLHPLITDELVREAQYWQPLGLNLKLSLTH